MKYPLKIVILLLLPILVSFNLHKYYVSLCDIEHNTRTKSVQIIINFFIDDFELTINNETGEKLNIDTSQEIENIDEYFKNYLQSHLQFKINDQGFSYNYIGKEYEDDLIRFYLEIPNIEKITFFEVKNTCLFSEFEDQQNIVKLFANNKHKTFYLTKRNDKGLLNF